MTKLVHRATPEEIDKGLLALALAGGNSVRAAEALAGRGLELDDSTLRRWKDKHAERYAEIRESHAKAVESVIAAEARDIAIELADLEREALEATRQQIREGKHRDPASALRNAAVAKAVNIDKSLLLQDRPTSIVQHNSAADLLRQMEQRGWLIEGTADEIPSDGER